MKVTRSIETARLRELYNYDPETGVFTHKAGRNIGKQAGSSDASKGGYVRLAIPIGSGKSLLLYAHRCAWQIVHGHLSNDLQIDHVDGNRSDNRIRNLRPATPRQNQQNYPRPRNNTSGYKGVSWCGTTCSWRVRIRTPGGRITKTGFKSAEEASQWYQSLAELHFGPFAKPANDNVPQSLAS